MLLKVEHIRTIAYVKELFAGTRESIDVYIQWLTNLDCKYLIKRHEVIKHVTYCHQTHATRNVKRRIKIHPIKSEV